ncbi:antirepressor [Sphingomonas sp. BHC-A]|nr:antirepressor [Sphingomonas sp. BHC-A]
MSNDLIPFEFEHHTVRVILIDDEPWFVANDLCAVLGISNPRQALARLDDDEKGVSSTDTPGGTQTLNIVSESGMYSLVLGSRKAEARRFKKWVTSDLLPTLRRTGRYVMHEERSPSIMDQDAPRLSACVAVVREARRLYGAGAARIIWTRLGLPAPIADAHYGSGGEILAEAVRNWLVGRHYTTAAEVADAMGMDGSRSDLGQVTTILTGLGWTSKKVRNGERTENRWFGPASFEGAAA